MHYLEIGSRLAVWALRFRYAREIQQQFSSRYFSFYISRLFVLVPGVKLIAQRPCNISRFILEAIASSCLSFWIVTSWTSLRLVLKSLCVPLKYLKNNLLGNMHYEINTNYKLIQNYTNLYEFIQIYTSLYKFIQICTHIYEYEYIQIYTNLFSLFLIVFWGFFVETKVSRFVQ